MKTKKSAKRKSSKNPKSLTFCIILGASSTIVILFALLVLFCCITLNAKNPHAYLSPLSFFAIYTSTFFGGFIATKKNGSRDSLLCGALTGLASTLLLCLIFLVAGAIFQTQSTPLSWLFRAGALLFSIIGALLATKRKKAPPKKHKAKRRR